jgi:type II secretory pathway pseudopilin PulG
MKKNAGYTLVELLVVLGVTVLLSSLLIVYSHEGERMGNIMRVRAQVVADINRAKNLAITARDWNGERTCGYGVYFDTNNNQYIIFTDRSNDCGSSQHLRGQDNTADVEIINVPQKFQLMETNVQQVFFMPPNPTVFFDGDVAENSSTTEVLITFIYQNETQPAFVVHINPIGQVWAY